jgi:purine catabolism regulator
VSPLAALREALFPWAELIEPASGPPAAASGTGAPAGAALGATPAQRPGSSPESAPTGWVRVMRARVPAFDALEPGDLAIVPSATLALVSPAADVSSLAAAAATARIGGFILVEGESGPDDPTLDALAAAAAGAGVPALRLPRVETQELERSVVAYLVNARAELEHQAAELEARLERAALEGAGPAGLVAIVAAFIGRPVALEGRRGDVLAVHAPAGAARAAGAVAAYHARPRAAAAARVPLPAGAGQAGAIALLGDRPIGALERAAVDRIAGLLALELARDEAVGRAREGRRAEALPAAGPPWVVLLARQRSPGQDDDGVAATERRELARRELRLFAPARRMALRGDADSLEIRAVIAVDPVPGPDPEGIELGGRIAGFLGRTVAISRPFHAAAERPAAEAEARETLQAAEALHRPPVVARATRLAAYRLMGNLHNLPDGPRLARALLAPLYEGRPDVTEEHLATLRAILDHGGVNEAATVLGVHRNTIAYRLRRIEARTGWRLADPELRLPLALALRLVQED